MIVETCKLLFKISLLITISSSKSIEKREAYHHQYQQPYYHQTAVGHQGYVAPHNQQYQQVSENQYQQDQIEHINQQLKHQFREQPQTQAYYNQDRVQNYQQSNYNQDQLNGRYINQHQGQHPVHFEDHYSNTEDNYKQNRRHTNEEDVQQKKEEQIEVKEEKTEQTVSADSTVITEKPDNSTKNDEEVLQKGSDNDNEISGEILKQTKNEEDCKSEEYLAAKHEIEEPGTNKEASKSEEYLAAKHAIEEQGANKEDCKSEEYLAAKHAIEETDANKEDCKSKEYLEAKHITDENEAIDKTENAEHGKTIITQPNEVDDELVKDTNENIEKIHHDLDPHSVPTTGDNTRNERTIIGRLHETDDPRMLIDNFRHKLKTARNNIEQMELASLRKADPRGFIYSPNVPKIPHAYPNKFHLAPVAPNYQNNEGYHLHDHHNYRQSKFDGLNGKSTAIKGPDAGRIITSPVIDDNFSDSSEEKKIEDNKTTGPTVQNNAEENTEPQDQKPSAQEKTSRFTHRNSPPEEITQLLHVRDEINRIRGIMQTLKEHEMKQKFGPSHSSRNLTDVEQKELKDFVDKLKKDGKISTVPLRPQNPDEDGIQSNPPEVPSTNQLIQDIGKLKESIQHFAKNVGIHKGDSTEANLEKLEEQIGAQKHEIENLRKLIEDLLPPTDFPSPSGSTIIKHPDLEKRHLHHELQALQATLSDLLSKEEATLKTAQTVAENLHARASDREPKINSKEASEKEIGTLVKILHNVQHPETDQDVITKLEQMSHEIKKLDIQNQRARQELLLEKLEREVKNLKDLKASSGNTNEELAEKQRKLEEEIKRNLKQQPKTINSKLEDLQKEIQKLSKPMGRELDGNIEKELDRLQKKIESMGIKNDDKPASGRQLEGLLSDILSNAGDNSIENHETSGSNLPPHSILNAESNNQAPVFQIPYCLQKHPNYAIYQDASNLVQPGYEQTYHQPEIQQQLNTNYNGPQPTYKFIPQPQQVIIQPVQQQFQPQRPIYLPPKPVPQLYQPPKPTVHQVYGPKRPPPPVYAPQKPSQPIYEPVKPTNVEVHQEYSPPTYSAENQYKPTPNTGYDQKPCGHSVAMEDEIKKLNSMLSILNEKIEYGSGPESENYDASYRSKSGKPRTKREIENADYEKQQLIREIRERLADLREQVQTVDEPQSTANTSEEQTTGKRSAYYQTDGSSLQHLGSKLSLKKKQKFDDLFIKVVKFILHKLEISAPYVIESLFNGEAFTYEQDYDGYNNNNNGGYDYNNGYRSSQKFRSNDDDFDNYVEDNDESDARSQKSNIFGGLLNNFQGLFPGLLGFIPNILLKLLSNFSSFLNILKRNKFFKNFLFPGALILVIDGIMALLIWWFSDDDTQNLFDFNINNQLPNVQNNRYL